MVIFYIGNMKEKLKPYDYLLIPLIYTSLFIYAASSSQPSRFQFRNYNTHTHFVFILQLGYFASDLVHKNVC